MIWFSFPALHLIWFSLPPFFPSNKSIFDVLQWYWINLGPACSSYMSSSSKTSFYLTILSHLIEKNLSLATRVILVFFLVLYYLLTIRQWSMFYELCVLLFYFMIRLAWQLHFRVNWNNVVCFLIFDKINKLSTKNIYSVKKIQGSFANTVPRLL